VTPQARAKPAAPAPATAGKASQQGPAVAAASPAAGKSEGKQVKVQSGETAGKIAAANKPANISLDQMLVALLNANPEAFIGGNVNRLKAGAVLEIPSAEQAGQESTDAAHQTVIAQSRDFNDFRRRLAEGMPATKVAPAERQASGKLEAQVQEKKPAAPSPDKLTLSKGAAQGKAVEDKIAREREAKDAAMRLAELNKNISDLNRLSTSAPAVAPAAATSKPPPRGPLRLLLLRQRALRRLWRFLPSLCRPLWRPQPNRHQRHRPRPLRPRRPSKPLQQWPCRPRRLPQRLPQRLRQLSRPRRLPQPSLPRQHQPPRQRL